MKDIKETIRLLENFNLKVIAEAEDSETLKQEIIGYLKGCQLEPQVMQKIAEVFDERIEYFIKEQEDDDRVYVEDQLSREFLVKGLRNKVMQIVSNFSA